MVVRAVATLNALRIPLALTVFALGAAVTTEARADRRPSIASDAFYVGMRVGPGVALVGAWDLDVYLSRSRAVSLGPGVSVALLGSEAQPGERQNVLVMGDVLRLKVQLNEAGGVWRPYFLVGGGAGFVWLRAEDNPSVTVTPPGGTPVTGRIAYGEVSEFFPAMVAGMGADLYLTNHVALAFCALSRFRLTGTERLPDAWAEMNVGVRFGL